MLGVLFAASTVVGTVVPFVVGKANEMDAADEMAAKKAIREFTGAAARMPGATDPIENSKYAMVPGDPALGGSPTIMTPEEAVWWYQVGIGAPDKHIPRIRAILRQQSARQEEIACAMSTK